MGLGHDEFWTGMQTGLVLNLIARYMDDELAKRRNDAAIQMAQIQFYGLMLGARPDGNETSDAIPEGW